MRISTKQGNRGKGDRIITLQTRGGVEETLSLRAILEIIQLFMENEDRLHPRNRGEKGRWLIYEAITELANGKQFDRVANEFLIPKAIKKAKQFMHKKMSIEDRKHYKDLFEGLGMGDVET